MSAEDDPVDVSGEVPFFGQVAHRKTGNLEVRHDPPISEQNGGYGANLNGDVRPEEKERPEEITERNPLKHTRDPYRVQVVVRKPV